MSDSFQAFLMAFRGEAYEHEYLLHFQGETWSRGENVGIHLTQPFFSDFKQTLEIHKAVTFLNLAAMIKCEIKN